MRIVIATVRKWNINNAKKFALNHPEHECKMIFDKKEFHYEEIEKFSPDIIFFPHWSWIIPKEIFTRYKCIVFHPSDVPNGKGGSPIQNQIAEGLTSTKISAISVADDIDGGDIYCKTDLSLLGGGEEIFIRMSNIIFEEMMPYILENNPKPAKQQGEGYTYKRRKETESDIDFACQKSLLSIFNQIRMLDADGYPRAYINIGDYRLTFSRPKLETEKVVADVEIEIRN